MLSFLQSFLNFFKPRATLKYGHQSELDLFFHDYQVKQHPSSNPLREQEIRKHQALFHKRDNPVEVPISKIWQDF